MIINKSSWHYKLFLGSLGTHGKHLTVHPWCYLILVLVSPIPIVIKAIFGKCFQTIEFIDPDNKDDA